MRWRKRYRGPEGYYHVFNRAARRLKLFADDADRAYYVSLLGRLARKVGLPILAWCLMDNHYHFCVRADGTKMGRLLRDLEKTYARYFNEKTGFSGALFEGRFGSVWLPDLESVTYVTRYIHANCRDKGIRPESYAWSSCRTYLGETSAPDWLDPLPVLARIGGSEAYRKYLALVPPPRTGATEADKAQAEFISHIQERTLRTLNQSQIDLGQLSPRIIVAWVGIRCFGLRPKVLASALGLSSGHCVSTGVHRLERRLADLPELRHALEEMLIK